MFAQKDLIQCKHQCHKSLKFLFPDQNSATQCGSDPVSPEEVIDTAELEWWGEIKRITSINANNDFNSIQATGDIGHFAQMARDTTSKIGCAMMTTNDGGGTICNFITCYYALGNLFSDPVYAVGAPSSGCQTQSAMYPGLCGPDEDYYGYQSSNVPLFNNDQTVTDDLRTFLSNKRSLLGSAAATKNRKE